MPVNPNPEPEVKEIKLTLVDESGQEIYLYAYVEGPAIKFGIPVPGIKFADETNATRVTNNEWSKRTYGDDIGTKTILVYVTKDGQTYSAPITVQTAGGCITAGTVIITDDLRMGVIQ